MDWSPKFLSDATLCVELLAEKRLYPTIPIMQMFLITLSSPTNPTPPGFNTDLIYIFLHDGISWVIYLGSLKPPLELQQNYISVWEKPLT